MKRLTLTRAYRNLIIALELNACFLALLLAFCTLLIWFKPSPRQPIIIPAARYPDTQLQKLEARDDKIESELRAIRNSLDHVTVRVHFLGCTH